MVLEVKVDKAIENNMERMKRRPGQRDLREKAICGVTVDRVEGTLLHIKAAGAPSADRVRGLFKSDFASLVEAKPPQTVGGAAIFI